MCKQDMMSSRWKWCCVQIHGGWSYSSINTWRSRSSSSTRSRNQLCASLPPEHRHICTQHLEMIRHPEKREALLIEPWLITQEEAAQRRRRRARGEMKGNKVSVSLRRHSGEQAQTTSALLYSASTQDKGKKEKVTACANMQTLHTLPLLLRAHPVDTYNSLTLK